MNGDGEVPSARRYIRWAACADGSFDRYFAMWSHVQVVPLAPATQCALRARPHRALCPKGSLSRRGSVVGCRLVGCPLHQLLTFGGVFCAIKGTDLFLYELPDKPAGSALGSIRPAPRGVNRDVKGSDIVCMDFRKNSEHPLQFAAGLTSGHAVVSSFQLFEPATDRDCERVVLRANVRHGRACQAVAWNQVHEGRLLTVFGGGDSAAAKAPAAHSSQRAAKHDDHAVYVWDISLQASRPSSSLRDFLVSPEGSADSPSSDMHVAETSDTSSHGRGEGSGGFVGRRARGGDAAPAGVTVMEARNARSWVRDEAATCGAWIYESAHTLVVGCGKSLRFIDLRDPKVRKAPLIVIVIVPVMVLAMVRARAIASNRNSNY